jgi:glutathione synthase/RimK-type ligase-like ATP-grasp enzyme
MRFFVVVDQLSDWALTLPGVEVITAKEYLTDEEIAQVRHARVFNLCRSFRYQSFGYYVSLLAEARGHKPMPSVQTISDLKSPSMTRFVSDELEEMIQQSLKHLKSEKFFLSIYFGKNVAHAYDRLSSHLFSQFPTPLMQASFQNVKGKWALQNIHTLIQSEIPTEHVPFVREVATEYLAGKRVQVKKKNAQRYDLAILVNPQEKTPPSDKKALNKFQKAAEKVGFEVDFITKEDYNKLAEYDALFIRETTGVNHHTFRFARRASAEGLVVIDDPESILKCTNKVYLSEVLNRYRIPIPKTVILQRDNIDEVNKIGFPCVLKQPDSSFSNGVIKVEDQKHLLTILPELLDKSDLLIAQEFIPTAFDWRVTIFDGQPLFACKYFMARRHWQIYETLNSGKVLSGRHETIPVGNTPKKVLSCALKAAQTIGNGFYGVDIKEFEDQCYVIEVNDNPSIESGCEDQILHDELYEKIMGMMMRRVESMKSWSGK